MGCDIIVAVGKATLNGSVIFGKNSDRSPNESQPLEYHPHLNHDKNMIRCQNIEIPQAPVTYAHVGSRPYWLWGYEHGVNEFGVVIGNASARGSKEGFVEPPDQAGLIGMDLVRLGLERGKTAHEAMLIITNLLEQYGAGYCEKPYVAKYHSSYIIADPDEAWILETSGRYWVAKRIVNGAYHQGNHYTIQTDWDECHRDLISHAIEMGWCNSEKDFNFAKTYWDYSKTPITGSMIRYRRGNQLLEKYEGHINLNIMMEILRDHLNDTFLESFWAPGENFYASICCHERPWGGGQTAASMVVELDRNIPDPIKASCWASMTSPCTSLFMPLYANVPIPKVLSVADKVYSEESPWWIFKKLQRHTERNYPILGPLIRKFWKETEKRMIEQRAIVEHDAMRLIKEGKKAKSVEILQKFIEISSEEAIKQAKELNEILYSVEKITPKYKDLRETYLNSLNKEANIDI